MDRKNSFCNNFFFPISNHLFFQGNKCSKYSFFFSRESRRSRDKRIIPHICRV